MADVLERVADAMYEVAGLGDGEPIDRNDMLWSAMARAAVEALQEPSEGMQAQLTALGRAMVAGDDHDRDQYTWFAIKAYRAMLSQALNA